MCSESIVVEFAKITHHLTIMYCYPLIQSSSARANISMEVSHIPTQKTQELSALTRLETFFPFDPLSLPISKIFVKDCFQEWEGAEESEAGDPSDSELGASLNGMSLDERHSITMSLSH